MIYYYNQIQDRDLVLSVDNIILDASIPNAALRDLLDTMVSNIARGNKVQVVSWDSQKIGNFRHQTLFKLDDDKSFWLGKGLNCGGLLQDRYRIDANPNKVGGNSNYELIRQYLVRNSRNILCKIQRFDLAIDIPVDRSKCFLVKDKRLYIERRHGVEYTQYLGSKSSSVGRVKLYNKTAEAKLNYPLTRLELTLDPSLSYAEINMPTVYVLDETSMALDSIKVTKTERFIVESILHGHGKVTDLGRKTSAKIKRILEAHLRKIVISEDSYNQILDQIKTYCTYGADEEKGA